MMQLLSPLVVCSTFLQRCWSTKYQMPRREIIQDQAKSGTIVGEESYGPLDLDKEKGAFSADSG